ncbi:MAG: hypothetical protein J3R72DRAFT_101955 [Linnemannia gamsii]|nr:MAG: hypothetical protein J3R72DRAFT_101955 [Linnemannia gamsii]
MDARYLSNASIEILKLNTTHCTLFFLLWHLLSCGLSTKKKIKKKCCCGGQTPISFSLVVSCQGIALFAFLSSYMNIFDYGKVAFRIVVTSPSVLSMVWMPKIV